MFFVELRCSAKNTSLGYVNRLHFYTYILRRGSQERTWSLIVWTRAVTCHSQKDSQHLEKMCKNNIYVSLLAIGLHSHYKCREVARHLHLADAHTYIHALMVVAAMRGASQHNNRGTSSCVIIMTDFLNIHWVRSVPFEWGTAHYHTIKDKVSTRQWKVTTFKPTGVNVLASFPLLTFHVRVTFRVSFRSLVVMETSGFCSSSAVKTQNIGEKTHFKPSLSLCVSPLPQKTSDLERERS